MMPVKRIGLRGQMVVLTRQLPEASQVIVALTVGVVSFATHNLFLALIIGIGIERLLDFWSVKIPLPGWFYQLASDNQNH